MPKSLPVSVWKHIQYKKELPDKEYHLIYSIFIGQQMDWTCKESSFGTNLPSPNTRLDRVRHCFDQPL